MLGVKGDSEGGSMLGNMVGGVRSKGLTVSV